MLQVLNIMKSRKEDKEETQKEIHDKKQSLPSRGLPLPRQRMRSIFDFSQIGRGGKQLPLLMKKRILVKCRSGRKKEVIPNYPYINYTFPKRVCFMCYGSFYMISTSGSASSSQWIDRKQGALLCYICPYVGLREDPLQYSHDHYHPLVLYISYLCSLTPPSILGKALSSIVMATIILSCVIFVLSSTPSLQHRPSTCEQPACDNDAVLCPDSMVCPPQAPHWFGYIELVCIFIFTVEYAVRVLTVATVPIR